MPKQKTIKQNAKTKDTIAKEKNKPERRPNAQRIRFVNNIEKSYANSCKLDLNDTL